MPGAPGQEEAESENPRGSGFKEERPMRSA